MAPAAPLAARTARVLLEAGELDWHFWDEWDGDTDGRAIGLLDLSLENWVLEEGAEEIDEHFGIEAKIRTAHVDEPPEAEGRVFLTLEATAYNYIEMAPVIEILEPIHPRLPRTFMDMLGKAIGRVLRVWDEWDTDRVLDWRREAYDEYEGEEDFEPVPSIEDLIPAVLRKPEPLASRTVKRIADELPADHPARDILARVLAIHDVAQEIGLEAPGVRAPFDMDGEEPMPGFLFVVQHADEIHGCFEEFTNMQMQGGMPFDPSFARPIPADAEGARAAVADFRRALRVLAMTASLLPRLPERARILVEA